MNEKTCIGYIYIYTYIILYVYVLYIYIYILTFLFGNSLSERCRPQILQPFASAPSRPSVSECHGRSQGDLYPR